MPQQQSDNQAHLQERQIPADAITPTVRERLVDIAAVVVERRRGVVVFLWQPTLRAERKRVVEVEGGVVCGELVNTDMGLAVCLVKDFSRGL
jgi:hypothetical protein